MSSASKTFDESWHRVEGRRVRLRSGVRVVRQRFRGEIWYVLRDPLSNRFFRVRPPAYRFLCELERSATVGEAMAAAAERDSEGAPEQGEAVQLLGQLYRGGLLSSDVEGDVAALFESQREQDRTERRRLWASLLFLRIPLCNPDAFLRRTLPFVGWLISPFGALLWLAVVGWGIKELVENFGEFRDHSQSLLGLANLPWLYATIAVTKLFHEMGHAYFCRKFGGEVPQLGIILLVLNPLPYMDASSSWEFRDKWKRVLVASAGMIVEFLIAAIAVMVWVRVGDGVINRVAYNTIVIASVSTLLFNINPLLRFDGYHILADWLEMPNLGGRAQRMAKWLVDRFLFGIPPGPRPASSNRQATGLASYHAASLVYRMFLLAGILLFISTRLLLLGVILAIAFGIVWLVAPVLKAAWHVIASPALAPARGRAMAVFFGGIGLILGFLAFVPMPAHFRTDGVVASVPFVQVFTPSTGVLAAVETPSGEMVEAGQILLRFDNFELEQERRALRSQLAVVDVRLREASAADPQREPGLRRFREAQEERRAALDAEAARLTLRAPAAGRWLAPDVTSSLGMVVNRGQVIGLITGEERHSFSAVVSQSDVALVFAGNVLANEVKVRGQEGKTSRLADLNAIPAERGELPTASLGMLGGGMVAVDSRAGDGLATTEPIFEIRGDFPDDAALSLLHGQRGVVRYSLPWEPYLSQGIRMLQQLFQRKYRV